MSTHAPSSPPRPPNAPPGPRRRAAARAAVAAVATLGALAPVAGLGACGGDDPPAAIAFPSPGPFVGDAGRGGFTFGAASAATQIEDQNPNTDWYVWTQPTSAGGLGKGTGFVGDAARGYAKAIDDVGLAADLHLDSYRISIEWARVEPTRGQIDEAALAHYRQVLQAIRDRGLRPVVTVHHFSNPIWVADPRHDDCAGGPTDANLCGLGHPQGGPLVIAAMAAHARLLATRFGDLVDEWGTLNEPVNYLLASYGTGTFPPGRATIFDLANAFIPVVRDYLEAHAAMYAAIKAADTVDADHDGVAAAVGLSLSVVDWEPARANKASTDPADLAARDRVVYVYHRLVVDSLLQGTFDPNLDGTGDEPHPAWKGTLDWLGVQYYFRAGVSADRPVLPVVEVTPCFDAFDYGACLPPDDPTLCVPSMGYEAWADGLHDILVDYARRYPALPLVVTEGGLATRTGARRAENIVRSLEAIARARADGADVRGYYHWSLTDNFEWANGFVPRFGLYTVDYPGTGGGTYARTATLGAEVLRDVATARQVTPAQRARYGGTGPMTPEEGAPAQDFCTKIE